MEDFLYSADGTLTALVKDFLGPVERVLDINKNGYTVRAQVDTTGWTQAEVTKFMGKLNMPRQKIVNFHEKKGEWKAGPAKSDKPPQCWFCKQPGHVKPKCVEWLAWNEKQKLIECHNCGEKGHRQRWCKKPALSKRERVARKHKDDICRKCNEKGHLEVHNLCRSFDDMSDGEINERFRALGQNVTNSSMIHNFENMGVRELPSEQSSMSQSFKRARSSSGKSASDKLQKLEAEHSMIESGESSDTVSEEESMADKTDDHSTGLMESLIGKKKLEEAKRKLEKAAAKKKPIQSTQLAADGARISTRRNCAGKSVGSLNEKTLSQQATQAALQAALDSSKSNSGSK